MKKDSKIFLLTGDLGYGMFDKIRDDFPKQFLNCGAREFTMISMAAGMAREGLIPICYSITPFLLWRPAEVIRNYLNHEKIPVKLLGGGRDQDYSEDGFTHDAADDSMLLFFDNIVSYWPETIEELEKVTKDWLYNGEPSYLNLKR